MKSYFGLSILLAIILGITIGWIDTRPHWDDTGVSVFMILVASAFCGYLSNKSPWLIALAVGIWIPLFNLVFSHNFVGSLIALVPAFIGAYVGSFVHPKNTSS
jgi:hypothetical protein